MRIGVDPVDGLLLPCLPTPPIAVGDEEQLLLGKVLQSREEIGRTHIVALFPCEEGSAQTARIRNVLTQRQAPVDSERLAMRTGDREMMVLVDKTLRLVLECFDGVVVPPAGVVSSLVIMSTGGVKRTWIQSAMGHQFI